MRFTQKGHRKWPPDLQAALPGRAGLEPGMGLDVSGRGTRCSHTGIVAADFGRWHFGYALFRSQRKESASIWIGIEKMCERDLPPLLDENGQWTEERRVRSFWICSRGGCTAFHRSLQAK